VAIVVGILYGIGNPVAKGTEMNAYNLLQQSEDFKRIEKAIIGWEAASTA
jgi:hypothetical protein